MMENEILKTKLKEKLNKLNMSENAKNDLVAEFNCLSNLLVDIYLDKKNVQQNTAKY